MQGNTILKPLAGAQADAPAGLVPWWTLTARTKHWPWLAAILPEWGKTDPYAMGTGTVDECVRQLILVGSNPDKIGLLDNFCMGNPEDPAELGRLVECVKAIAKAADAYNAPFISGKDSFYNYFETEDGPINVPVTFLCSGFGVVENPDHVIGSSLRRSNSLLYLIGHTEDEMGGSVFAAPTGWKTARFPRRTAPRTWSCTKPTTAP